MTSFPLVLDVLAHDLNGGATTAHCKVARAPQVSAPQAALHLWELPGPEHPAAHPLETVDQA